MSRKKNKKLNLQVKDEKRHCEDANEVLGESKNLEMELSNRDKTLNLFKHKIEELNKEIQNKDKIINNIMSIINSLDPAKREIEKLQNQVKKIETENLMKCKMLKNVTNEKQELENKYIKLQVEVDNLKKEIDLSNKPDDVFNGDCLMCSEHFVDNVNLQHHLVTFHSVNGSTLYSCNSCEKTFSVKSDLHSHQIYVHSQETLRKSSCINCGKLFDNLLDFQSHMKMHMKEAEKKTWHMKQLEIQSKLSFQKVNLVEGIKLLRMKENSVNYKCNCKGNCSINHWKFRFIPSVSLTLFEELRKHQPDLPNSL